MSGSIQYSSILTIMKSIPYIFGAFMLLALAAIPLSAQQSTCDTLWRRVRIYYIMGPWAPGFDAMNADLQRAGMPGIKARPVNDLSSGIGSEYVGASLAWGWQFRYASGSGMETFQRIGGDYDATARYQQYSVAATMSIMRSDLKWSLLSVIPRIGIGIDIASLELGREPYGPVVPGPAVMEGNWQQSVTLTRVSPSLDICVIGEINILLPRSLQSGSDTTMIPIGVAAGYHLDPLRNAWRSDGAVTGLSVPGLSSFYFHFTLGLDFKMMVCPNPGDE